MVELTPVQRAIASALAKMRLAGTRVIHKPLFLHVCVKEIGYVESSGKLVPASNPVEVYEWFLHHKLVEEIQLSEADRRRWKFPLPYLTPVQLNSSLLEFLDSSAENQANSKAVQDGPTQNGIILSGVEYRLTPRALEIARLCWAHPDKSVPILDASDDHAYEMTLETAKARQKDFNKAVCGSGWEMSLAKDRFTIREIESNLK